MKQEKGSITIYMALCILLVFSVIFSMLELSRVYGLKSNVVACTEQAADGVMASYQRQLWEQYRLLFYEETEADLPGLQQMKTLQQDLVEGNWTDPNLPIRNYYMLQVHLEDVEVSGYELATDGNGAAFRKEAAQMMKASVGEATLQMLLDQADHSREEAVAAEDKAINALEAVETGATEKEQASATAPPESDGSGTVETAPALQADPATGVTRWNNPLRWAKTSQWKGVLGIVMPNADISSQTFSLQDAPDKRSLQVGTMGTKETLTPGEEMLFRMYLTTYYKNALDQRADGKMQYEAEYIIAGKGSDRANLKAVVNRLLLMREVVNLAYLETDVGKQEEVTAVALAICSVFGVPELEEVAKQGVMAAWAYGESLCDVKILMSGGKVSPVKTRAQWHTDLMNMGESIRNINGSDQTTGLSYENYLAILMGLMGDGKLSNRAMHVIEKNLGVRMDLMVCRMEGMYQYKAEPLFWNFVILEKNSINGYTWKEPGAFSYIDDTQ